MSAFFVLISTSIIIALGFLAAFIWSVNNGQYDDDYTPSVRMLFDVELVSLKKKEETDIHKNYKNQDKLKIR